MPNKSNIKLIIAYDGSNYLGYQDNRTGETIENSLRKALEKILQEKIILQAASRTDKGVHANGQVVNFFSSRTIELDNLVFRLNQCLQKDIRILSAKKMPPSFHPTLEAKAKTYIYYINTQKICSPHLNKISWHIFKKLNIEAMKDSARYLIGEKDFRAFTNRVEENNVREILDIQLTYKDPLIIIQVYGVSFLYKMVRNIVGTLLYVGLEKFKANEVRDILASKDRKQAGPTAPAHGLFLDSVKYS